MNSTELIQQINKDFELALTPSLSGEILRQTMAVHINDMILHQFDRLVQLLYRMDVSESKLKEMLQVQAGTDAGYLIAGLVLEREQQKIASRRQFTQQRNNDSEAETW
jgi:hypothetical protein